MSSKRTPGRSLDEWMELVIQKIRRGLTLLQNSFDKEKYVNSLAEKKQDDMRHEYQSKMPEVADKIKFYIGDVRNLQSNWSRRGLTLLQNSFNKEKYVNSLVQV